jgi:hypothetical protein
MAGIQFKTGGYRTQSHAWLATQSWKPESTYPATGAVPILWWGDVLHMKSPQVCRGQSSREQEVRRCDAAT